MFIVIGLGPNSVEVPCLWFSSKHAAIEYVSNLLGAPDTKGKNSLASWNVDEEFFSGHYDEEKDEEIEGLSKHFFTSYYDGCGKCYKLVLRQVEEGTPFVRFDLD